MRVHVDYQTVTERVAARIIKASLPRVSARWLKLDGRGNIKPDGLLEVIARVARQVAQQGLSPDDLDRIEGGQDALRAIADVAPVPQSVRVPWQQLCLLLPDDWTHVVNEAARQLAQQIQRAPK